MLSNEEDDTVEGLKLIEEVYLADPQNVNAIKFLADHLFMLQKYAEADKLVQKGLRILEGVVQSTDPLNKNKHNYSQLKADLLFLQGKTQHVQEKFSAAELSYAQALQLDPLHHASLFNSSKIAFAQSNFVKAEENLTKLLSCTNLFQESFEVLSLLGRTLVQIEGKQEKAKELLKRAIEVNHSDFITQVELAKLYEKTDMSTALRYYEFGIQNLRR